MVNGMDSTRNGPLSTLILMLPLIVVPALVVLRPAAPDGGLGNNDLTAADGDQFPVDGDNFDSMFGESITPESSSDDDRPAEFELRDEPRSELQPVDPTTIDHRRTPPAKEAHSASPPIPRSPSDVQRSPDLSDWGVTKSVWFSPGVSGEVGFAAFVPTSDESVRYRFAAIGTSDQQVIQNVVHQIEDWQSTQKAASGRRAN